MPTRKFATCYLTGFANVRQFRDAITRAEGGGQFREVVDLFFPDTGDQASAAA